MKGLYSDYKRINMNTIYVSFVPYDHFGVIWDVEEEQPVNRIYEEAHVAIRFRGCSPFIYGLSDIWRHIYENGPLVGIVSIVYLKPLLIRGALWVYNKLIMNLPGLYKELKIYIWDWMKNILLFKKYDGVEFR